MRRLMCASVAFALTAFCAAQPVVAQQNAQPCIFTVKFVGDTGAQFTSPNGIDYFGGGRVRLGCRGTSIVMESDSIAAYDGARVVYFIGHVNYRDSTSTLVADNGTYFKDGERWEARGSVKTRNLETGSTLEGPSVDYFRKVKGVRDTAETYAVSRPTIHYNTKDSAGVAQEPYVIVGDRVRMKGDDRVWAGGKVTVDRSDLAARGDSMRLDTGKGQDGTLIGSPELKGFDKDTFRLTGTRIDFSLIKRQLHDVVAKGDGHLVSKERDLVADTIQMAVNAKKLTRTTAWGKTKHPSATATGYAIKGDSLIFESPHEVLEQTRAYGSGWAATKADSIGGERDWVAGDSVIARFTKRDSSSVLTRLDAYDRAKAYYRGHGEGKDNGSLSYSRGDLITVYMRTKGEEGVERVVLYGQVDGVQLERESAKPSPGAAPTP